MLPLFLEELAINICIAHSQWLTGEGQKRQTGGRRRGRPCEAASRFRP